MTHKQWFNNVLHLHPVHEEGAKISDRPARGSWFSLYVTHKKYHSKTNRHKEHPTLLHCGTCIHL